ncbi:sigma factor-like helix-turn-helix DNA-binding protein, partial [Bacteroides heparinolyticus]
YTPHDELIAKDLQLLMDMVVSKMPPKRKLIYELSRKKGLSNEQIAEKLGIQKKTVENHLNIALNELRETLSLSVLLYLILSA